LERCIEPAAKKSAISVIHRLLNDAGNRRQFARDKGLDRLSPWLMPYLGVPRLAKEASELLVLVAKTSPPQRKAVLALDLPAAVRARIDAVKPGFTSTAPTTVAKNVDFMSMLGGAAAARRSSKPTTESLLGDFARQADEAPKLAHNTAARASYAAPRTRPALAAQQQQRPVAKTTDHVQQRPTSMAGAAAPAKSATLHANAAQSSAAAAAASTPPSQSQSHSSASSIVSPRAAAPKVGSSFSALTNKPRNNTMALLKQLEEEAVAEVCVCLLLLI
jgi:hypothetical protein